jgi:hypothetical protein
MVRLERIDITRLRELVTDAWHMRAPAELKVEHPCPLAARATGRVAGNSGIDRDSSAGPPGEFKSTECRQCRKPSACGTVCHAAGAAGSVLAAMMI